MTHAIKINGDPLDYCVYEAVARLGSAVSLDVCDEPEFADIRPKTVQQAVYRLHRRGMLKRVRRLPRSPQGGAAAWLYEVAPA
jgi:predicted transcriptional regulator